LDDELGKQDMRHPRLTLRIDFVPGVSLGPGKVRLLELIGAHGSISAAGRAMGMSYRRAWLLVDSLNQAFGTPLVAAKPGGSGGGGAALLPMGRSVVHHYRALEQAAKEAGAVHLRALEDARIVPSGDTAG
jgi:molybdate transport system regulatory protein